MSVALGGYPVLSRQTPNRTNWDPKIEAIRANEAPDYAFMGFDPDAWRVTDHFLVPGHF